jgi:hypothetical protein
MLAVVLAVAASVAGCGDLAVKASPTTDQPAPAAAPPATPPPAPTTAADPDGWETIGTSVQGRPIRMRTFGHGPRKVLFIGGIHGDEAEGAYTTAQLPAALADAGLADTVTLTILEDANPDGRAAGTRTNANGVDINRNFPATNFDTSNPAYGSSPLSQPESQAVYQAVERVGPNLVMVAHAWSGRQFINFDGPAKELAQRFSAMSGLPVEASNTFVPTPGSLGSYVGRDRGTPILTIEVLKGTNPTDVWDRLREALLQAIRG